MVRDSRSNVKEASARPMLDFGKYNGCGLDEVPRSYLQWLTTQRWVDHRIRAAAEKILEIDQDECDAEPDPTSAAIAFPLIVFEWKRTMFRAFEGDRDALEVVGRGLRELRSLCSGLTRQPWPEDAEATP